MTKAEAIEALKAKASLCDAMEEDEAMRNTKPTHLEQRLHDTETGIQDERPWVFLEPEK